MDPKYRYNGCGTVGYWLVLLPYSKKSPKRFPGQPAGFLCSICMFSPYPHWSIVSHVPSSVASPTYGARVS